jgi:hypothetical protein
MPKVSRIMKVAGLSLAGFCAVSLVADKVISNPEASQVAGYCGAFLGALVGRGRAKKLRESQPEPSEKQAEQAENTRQAQ